MYTLFYPCKNNYKLAIQLRFFESYYSLSLNKCKILSYNSLVYTYKPIFQIFPPSSPKKQINNHRMIQHTQFKFIKIRYLFYVALPLFLWLWDEWERALRLLYISEAAIAKSNKARNNSGNRVLRLVNDFSLTWVHSR